MGLSLSQWQIIASGLGPLVAALVAAVVAVKFAGYRLRKELEGRAARQYLLEEGLLKLAETYGQLLASARLNYAEALALLQVMRDIRPEGAIAPRPDDLPPLTAMSIDAGGFTAIGPSSRLLDFPGLGELTTRAFSALYSYHLLLRNQIWIPARGLYGGRATPGKEVRQKACEELVSLATTEYHKVERFGDVPDLLRDAALRATQMGLNGFADFWRIRRSKGIKEIRDKLSTLLEAEKKTPLEAAPKSSP